MMHVPNRPAAAVIAAFCLAFLTSVEARSGTSGADALQAAALEVVAAMDGDRPVVGLTPALLAEALSLAAQTDRPKAIRNLLRADVEVDARNASGSTALYLAVAAGAEEAVAALVEAGADPRAPHGRMTPLALAREAGQRGIVERLAGPGGMASDEHLLVAALQGDVAWLEALLAQDASVHAVGPEGWGALHLACAGGHAQAVTLLLSRGADPDLAGADGVTPLGLAAARGDAGVVRALLGARADPNRPSGGVPPLSLALLAEADDVLELLIAAGADPAQQDHGGMRPSDAAVLLGRTAWVERMGGASRRPEAALHQGIVAADEELVRAAIEAGADVSRPGPEGYAPVVLAAAKANAAVVRALLEGGASVEERGPGGATLVHLAAANPAADERAAILDEVLRVAGPERTPALLQRRDQSGRSGMTAHAAQKRPRGGWLSIQAFLTRAELIQLANERDEDGFTPFLAAVVSENMPFVDALRGRDFVPAPGPDGITAQELARARELWASLAALPDDRDIPIGVQRGASREVMAEMQRRLRDWGYYRGAVDGAFGPQSQEAMTAFLRDRERELIGMAEAQGQTSRRTGPDDVVLSVTRPSAEGGCIWRVMHWRPGRPGDSTRFVGCVAGQPAWNSNGFGYIEYQGRGAQLRLFGAGGWHDEVEFR
jgi:ankyrin repeat protein